MTLLVPIVMFSWPLIVVMLFLAQPLQRAVVAAFVSAWLFLPVAKFSIEGFTDYNKMTATCGGVLIGVLMLDPGRFARFRLTLSDLPMAVWCVIPAVSSITNGNGVYDAISAVVYQTVTWGVPYFIGRACLGDREGVRTLAMAMLIGGLIYVPLCLFEARMSPQLHSFLYGSQPGHFMTTMRYGGFRPTVFMKHGLMVAVWMCSTTLIGAWLYKAGIWKRSLGVPAWAWLALMVCTAILCKSTGALALFVIVGVVLVSAVLSNSSYPIWALVTLPSLWMVARSVGWSAGMLVELAGILGRDRAGSFLARLSQEDRVISVALQKPWFGWATWQSGQDQLWLLAIRNHGLVGIAAFAFCFILPIVVLTRRLKPTQWVQPAYAPCAALVVVLLLYAMDHLFNAMINPIFMLAAGATTGLLASSTFAVEPEQSTRERNAPAKLGSGRYMPTRQLKPGHA